MSKKRNRKNSYGIRPSPYAQRLLRQTERPYWERLSQVFAIALLAVFPLMIGESGYANITADKFGFFKNLTLFYLAGAALLWLLCLKDKSLYKARQQKCPQKLSIPQIALLLHVLWGVICALASDQDQLWIGFRRNEGVFSMLLYAAVFLALSLWGEYSDYLLPALSVMAITQAVLSLSQLWGGGLLYPQGYNFYDLRFVGTLGNIDFVSGFAALMIPALVCGFILLETRFRYAMLTGAALLLAVQIYIDVDSGKVGLLVSLLLSLPFLCSERKRMIRTLYAFAVLLAAAGIFRYIAPSATGVSSSGAPLFLLAALLLAAAGFLLSKKEGAFPLSPRTILIALAALELAAAAAALVYLFQYSGSNPLLRDAHEFLHGRLDDTAGSGRGLIWKVTVSFMNDNPIFGCGPGGFARALVPYYNYEELGQWIDAAHNDFLHIGACTGYVGLFFYVVFVVSLAVRALKNVERCPLLLIFAGAVAGYLAHSFFSFSVPIVSPLFWGMAGLLEKLIRQIPPDEATPPAQ